MSLPSFFPFQVKSSHYSPWPIWSHEKQQLTYSSVNTAKTREHSKPCVDNGTWLFSYNDVSGQERDVQNNFGQWGTFTHPSFNMYPKRAKESLKCEFC